MENFIIYFICFLVACGFVVYLIFSIRLSIKVNKEIKETEQRIKEKRKEFERIRGKGIYSNAKNK